MNKCKCTPDETTGWTQVKCCNICGKPVEDWGRPEPSTINELAIQIHQNSIEKGFFEKEKNIGEMLCLIHSEVSEALEADRISRYANTFDLKMMEQEGYTWKDNEASFKWVFATSIKNSFEDELADIMIRVMDLAAYKGIDLEFHIKQKMQYNSLREHKHGKKY